MRLILKCNTQFCLYKNMMFNLLFMQQLGNNIRSGVGVSTTQHFSDGGNVHHNARVTKAGSAEQWPHIISPYVMKR